MAIYDFVDVKKSCFQSGLFFMNKTFLVGSSDSSVGSFVVVVPLDFGWAGLGFGVGYSSLALLDLVVELAKTKFPFLFVNMLFLVISCKPKLGHGTHVNSLLRL